jgi:hypothetical protein
MARLVWPSALRNLLCPKAGRCDRPGLRTQEVAGDLAGDLARHNRCLSAVRNLLCFKVGRRDRIALSCYPQWRDNPLIFPTDEIVFLINNVILWIKFCPPMVGEYDVSLGCIVLLFSAKRTAGFRVRVK